MDAGKSKPTTNASRPRSQSSARSKPAEGGSKPSQGPKQKDRATVSSEARESETRSSKQRESHTNALASNFGGGNEGRKLNEGRGRGGECLDRAAEMARKDDQAVFLRDHENRDGNNAGHVVLEREGRVLDPVSGKSYDNLGAYSEANPQYSESGRTSGENLQRIVNAPTQEAREQAIREAGLEGLQNEKFADVQAPRVPSMAPGTSATVTLEKGYSTQLGDNVNVAAQGTGSVTGSLEAQRPVQTKDGEFVQTEFRQTQAVSAGDSASAGPASASFTGTAGTGLTFTGNVPREDLESGNFPNPSKPEEWKSGTSFVMGGDSFQELGLEASLTPQRGLGASASNTINRRSSTDVYGIQRDGDVIRTFQGGDRQTVENQMKLGPQIGAAFEHKSGPVEAHADFRAGLYATGARKFETTSADFTEKDVNTGQVRNGHIDQTTFEAKNGLSAEVSADFGVSVGGVGTRIAGSAGFGVAGQQEVAERTRLTYDDGTKSDALTMTRTWPGNSRQLQFEDKTGQPASTTLSMTSHPSFNERYEHFFGSENVKADEKGVTLSLTDERAQWLQSQAQDYLSNYDPKKTGAISDHYANIIQRVAESSDARNLGSSLYNYGLQNDDIVGALHLMEQQNTLRQQQVGR